MSQAQLVGVMYVGKKPNAVDSLARSGVTWNGRGDVQFVSEDAAVQLCGYPDQWWPAQDDVPTQEEVDELVAAFGVKGDKSVLKPIIIYAPVVDGEKEKTRIAPPAGKKQSDYAKMTLTQLRKIANDEHGHKFKIGITTKAAADELHLLDEQARGQGR